jgi:hypothetical protein
MDTQLLASAFVDWNELMAGLYDQPAEAEGDPHVSDTPGRRLLALIPFGVIVVLMLLTAPGGA